jgi:hypothetical protein
MMILRKISTLIAVMLVCSCLPFSAFAQDSEDKPRKRPLYAYPGNYGDQVLKLKKKFEDAFGYSLMDGDQQWRPEEIQKLHAAFSQLPNNFYRMEGVKGFFRLGHFISPQNKNQENDIPAATYPQLRFLYRQKLKAYLAQVSPEPLRIEMFNPLFYEDDESFSNIVQHEMGHVFDVVHRFLSLKDEWLKLTGFTILHIPALDGREDSDFIFKLVDDADTPNYAPVSTRNLPTYSRQTPQEDFANSVAAYRHYPFFRYTHPGRYEFLKQHVFAGKEFFPVDGSNKEYSEVFLGRLTRALEEKNWKHVLDLVLENSRVVRPDIEKAIVEKLKKGAEQKISFEADFNLALASCYLHDPGALRLRKELITQKRIQAEPVLKNDQCRRMGRKMFENGVVRWPVTDLLFYRSNGRDWVQFKDPMALGAKSRGFETSYTWKLNLEGDDKLIEVSRGLEPVQKMVDGSVRIDLKGTVDGTYRLPEGKRVILEVGAQRMNLVTGQRFASPLARLRFVVQPWFNYIGPEIPSIQVVFSSGTSAHSGAVN